MLEAEHASLDLDIRAYVAVLRRRKWIIALATVAGLAVALASAFAQTPHYRSQSDVFVGRSEAAQFVDPLRNVGDPLRTLANEVRIAQSEGVAEIARKQLGYDARVSAVAASGTDVITFVAVDADAKRAARTANAFALAYIQYRNTSQASDIDDLRTTLREQVDVLQTQLDDVNRQIAASGNDAQRQELIAQREALSGQIATLRQNLAQLQLSAALASPARILASAVPPQHPFEPRPKRLGAIGLVVGFLVGVGAAILLDQLDDSIRSVSDLSLAAHGLPLLGFVPAISAWKDRGRPYVVSRAAATSPAAEAYRALRTSLQFVDIDQDVKPKVFQFTSAAAGDGKTTTVSNLGVVLARAGHRVVLVDADLRRPRLAKFFDVDATPGFTSVIFGDSTLAEAIKAVRDEPNLVVLGAGRTPSNPSEILSSPRVREVFNVLRLQADYILVDSPPAVPVTDPAVLSSNVDAVVVLATVGKTSKRHLSRALTLLEQVNARLVGIVANGSTEAEKYGYGYGYGYGYEAYTSHNGEAAHKLPKSRTS